MTEISIEQIKHLNKAKGQFFFSPGTMHFFHSRTDQSAFTKGNYAYFITSEQRERDTPRKYTIRKCNLDTGNVSTEGEFQEYDTHGEARHALESLLRGNSEIAKPESLSELTDPDRELNMYGP